MRQKKRNVLTAAVILSIICMIIDVLLTNGNRLRLVAITVGFIIGAVILVHELKDLTIRDIFDYGVCLVSAPLWAGFYFQAFGEWFLIAMFFGYGYIQAMAFIPIENEYRNIKVFLKSG